ncbi:major facilitator superfamily domain-containing protein [Lipomyces arxii]|uniref:major facilitator superfamily domain-containing protein n=1 Tax=Lipomyces arxii TaxID=56418 RepID=UPI0034CD6690
MFCKKRTVEPDGRPAPILESPEENRNRKRSAGTRVLERIWDSFGKVGEERSFLLKLDMFLLLYIVLSYLIKTLDSTNVNNAYVSGMKEDLSLYGNELSLFSTFYSIGYFLGSVPSQILINRVRPSLVIPSIEILWSAVTVTTAACQTAKTVYAVRLIMGLLEASIFPSFSHIIGSWYTPTELGKRYSLFYMAQPLANMFSGYIQAGVYTSLNGVHGLAGWRWLFIIDGIISVPVAAYGFIALPDYPNKCRAIYLNDRELLIANMRMDRVGRRAPEKITVKGFFGIWKSWRPYLFLTLYQLDLLTFYFQYFNLYLKSLGNYSVQELNLIPTGGYAVALVSGYVIGSISDTIGMRWPGWLFACCCKFVGCTILAVWPEGFHVKMFGFFIGYIGYAGFPLLLTWASEAFQDDPQSRGVMVGWGNCINMIFGFWWAIVVYPAEEAPTYTVGYRLISPMAGLEIVLIGAFYYMIKREQRVKRMVINEYGLAVKKDSLADLVGDTSETESIDKKSETRVATMEKPEDLA